MLLTKIERVLGRKTNKNYYHHNNLKIRGISKTILKTTITITIEITITLIITIILAITIITYNKIYEYLHHCLPIYSSNQMIQTI